MIKTGIYTIPIEKYKRGTKAYGHATKLGLISSLLASRFREALLHGTWIANTNFKAQLSELDWRLATQKIGDLNTIAMLAFHIDYYIAGIVQVMEGGSLDIRDKYSFDMPKIRYLAAEYRGGDRAQLLSSGAGFADHEDASRGGGRRLHKNELTMGMKSIVTEHIHGFAPSPN